MIPKDDATEEPSAGIEIEITQSFVDQILNDGLDYEIQQLDQSISNIQEL